ncbi:MAG: DUF1646 family protein [Candidatus Goldbacteria bacterium]|nr:DUF1646 family protein [Candidatus Goldiibacteriota bacterium]
MEIAGLFTILVLVFILPFIFKKVEEELELFLFIMGVIAVTITKQWNMHLIQNGLIEPIKITLAVLIAGILFNKFRHVLSKNVNKIENKIGLGWFVFFLVVLVGLFSSVITAIIASLVLVEIVSFLKLDRNSEVKLVVLACFSIGMGAILTPIGEPLSTIAISKLKGPPYNADFFFLLRRLGLYVVPTVLIFGVLAVFITRKAKKTESVLKEDNAEGTKGIIIRAVKVYFFVMALVFLGEGFKPLIDRYISKIHFYALYWINIISAVLDNATLAAAEIGPSMDIKQIDGALLGLIISGGILIPGNIPNIIAASKLKIKSKEWAKVGLPIGLSFLVIFFVILIFMEK